MKNFLIFLVVFLVVTNIVCLFYLIDRGVTIDYSRSAHTDTERSLSILLELSNSSFIGQSYQAVLGKIESDIEGAIIKARNNAIFVDSLVLLFDEGSLVEIRLLNKLSSEEYDRLEM